MKEHADKELDVKPDVVYRQGSKKKHGKNQIEDSGNDFFKGFIFRVGKDVPDL